MATAYATDSTRRYNLGARLFHATIAILIVTNLVLGIGHDAFEGTALGIPTHQSIGLTILALSIARLLWRLTWKTPPYQPPLAAWERTASRAMHWTLYALMIVIPLSGWLFSSASKYPLRWFGIPVPEFAVTKADPIVGIAHEGHEILGFVMLALVVGHVLAALRHHFALKDGLLRRMW